MLGIAADKGGARGAFIPRPFLSHPAPKSPEVLPTPQGQNSMLRSVLPPAAFCPLAKIAATIAHGSARLVEMGAEARDAPFLQGADALAEVIRCLNFGDKPVPEG